MAYYEADGKRPKGVKTMLENNETALSAEIGATKRIEEEDICLAIPPMPDNADYAFAYIRFQETGDLMSPEDALKSGTAFLSLDMPYCGKKR